MSRDNSQKEYFDVAVNNLKQAELQANSKDMFSANGVEVK